MKRIASAFAVAAIVASMMGCQLMDALFFNADEVKASELSTFTGDTPSTKDEALASAVIGLSTAVATSGIMKTITQAPGTVPETVARLLSAASCSDALASGAASLARTITPADAFTAFQADVEADGAGKLEVKLVAEDFDSDGVITVDGDIELGVTGATEGSTSASGSVKADLSATVESFTGTAFNGAIVNLKLDADANIAFNAVGDLTSLSGYAAFATFAGFSIDEIEGVCKGGKYVLGLKYTNSYSYSAAEADPTAAVDAELTLKVYDASNKVVGNYSYTDDELMAFAQSMEM